MDNPTWPEWYRNWLRFWREEANNMDNFRIATRPGIILVPADHINGQALVNWISWSSGQAKDDENGEVTVNQLFAPNGKTVAYLLDLRAVPERFERQLLSMIEGARKAGDCPLALAWLDKKSFTDT